MFAADILVSLVSLWSEMEMTSSTERLRGEVKFDQCPHESEERNRSKVKLNLEKRGERERSKAGQTANENRLE